MTEDGSGRTGLAANGASLARGGLALGVATALANVLGYGLTVVFARGYGPAEYGAIITLLGAALIGAIPSGGLQYVLARRTAARRLGPDRNEGDGLLLAAAVGGALGVLVIALAPAAAAFLHLDSAWPAVWLGVLLVPFTISGALLGSLLGHERYLAFGAAQVVTAVGRFGAGVVAVLAGLSVAGVMAALAGATAVTCGLVFWLSRPGTWSRDRTVRTADLVADLGRSCSAIAGLIVLSNMDLLLARHYLPREVSGRYALASLFAKACLWGTQFVPMVVFARLSRGGRQSRLLLRAALVTAAAGGLCVLVAAVAGSRIVATVAGGDSGYAGASRLVVPFAVLGTLWSLVQLALLAAVAAGDGRPGRLLWVVVPAEALAIALGAHHSPAAILATCLTAAGVLVVSGAALKLRGAAGHGRSRPAPRHAAEHARRPEQQPSPARH